MAISLQQVEKKNQRRKNASAKTTATRKPTASAKPRTAKQQTTAKTASVRKTTGVNLAPRELKKPWAQAPDSTPKSKKHKSSPLSEAAEQELSRPEMHQNWLFDSLRNHSIAELVNSETLQNLSGEVINKLQRKSYLLSKATHVADWLLSIEVSPKVKIPLPSALSFKERVQKDR